MISVVAAAAALVLAAEPQCPTDPQSCRYEHGARIYFNTPLYSCSTTNWMLVDYCDKRCPMRLVITDPPELRTWMCAMDNIFEPYAPESHIDLHHPLNNKVLEVEAVGHAAVGSTRRGCEAGDYAWGNKTMAGKITLARRGGCKYDAKARQAQAAQAAMLFVVDSWPYYSWRNIRGNTAGIETFPSFFTARQEADYVLAALDRGVKVKGMLQYQCNDMPEGYLDSPEDYPWDRCGDSFIALHDTCLKEDAPEPLCEVCTVELQLPGAEKLCLFGNELRPRKRETLMHTSWDMPYTAQHDEVVYTTELANRGCSVSDYAGLAGKILLVPETGRCTLYMTVRSAQEAGVKAYILVGATYFLQWYAIRGYSTHIHIPVHTVDYHATPKLQAFVANGGGRHIPGSGYALDAMTFTRGVPPPTNPPTPAPLPPVVVDNSPQLDTSPDFNITAGTVVCIIVVCVDLVVLVVLFVRQRRDTVHLPSQLHVKTFSLPLKVVSMGLSLTLLLLIAVVTFSLTRVAGQESTDRAMENGRAALSLSYYASAKNTLDLSNTVRHHVLGRVLVLLQKEIFNMEYKMKMVQDMFFGFNGSWEQFDARWIPFLRMQHNVDDSTEDVRLQVFTTRGFFMNIFYKTDDRPDEVRKDGVVGSVAQTEEGWRYGVNGWVQNLVTREFTYSTTIPSYQQNVSRMLSGNIGDPLAVTSGRPAGHTTWRAERLTFPLLVNTLVKHPMSAYRPLYGSGGQYHGTIEVMAKLSDFIGNVMHPNAQSSAVNYVELSAGVMENMSVVVVDDVDKCVLGAYNTDISSSQIVGYASTDVLDPLRGLHCMHQHPSFTMTALANYLDKVGGWRGHEGEFEQSEYFGEQPHLTLANIAVSGGRAADTGVHNWDVEMRDGACGACVVYDDQLQKEVLLFDGATTLHVYRNMTRNTPIVARSRVSGPGEPWRSKFEMFSDTLKFSDGTECVANTWHSTPTESEKRCLVRPDLSGHGPFMVSMRIRPDVAYTETSPHGTTPRLLSDTLVGEANIRLFANGQLYVFVLRQGCRTKAYTGGFPVGAWTTITAVVELGECRVFVNGTEYHRSMHSGLGPRMHANPYRVGQFFKGRLEAVQAFTILGKPGWESRLSMLHTEGRFVHKAEYRKYFAQTKILDMNSDQRDGVLWNVAVVIPRTDIMSVVDANRDSTMAAVLTQEDNTNKELTQKANATIMVIAAIAMTSVVAFLVFNTMMTRPFEETASIMVNAAALQLDSVPQGTSLITELAAMRAAMHMMLENLRLYRSFMPQSVQLSNVTTTHQPGTSDDTHSSASSSTASLSKESNRSNSSATPSVTQQRQLTCSVGRKRFSYTVLNIRGWHARVNAATDDDAISLHESLLEILLHTFSRYKGVSEVFSGDRFACSFNAAKVATQHKMLSCLCLLQCSAGVAKLSLSTSASAVSGEGRVGNIGNAAMRRFSFLTPVVTWGHALERFCCMLDAGILIDPVLHNEVGLDFVVQLADAVLFPKLDDKPLRVHKVSKRKEDGRCDEWMYELERSRENDPMREWNNFASRLFSNDFAELDWMTDVSQGAPPFAQRLVECFKDRCFEPFRILLH